MTGSKTEEPIMESNGPLKGVKVIDLTSVVMGPYATQILGDYGADVVKVEPPDGDVARQIGPMRHSGMGPIFLNSNRSKRSIVLDLKSPQGRDALLRIAADADILIYNIRPQAMERLRLGFEDVLAVNPRIIYAGVFGFGQGGPYSAKPAYDDLIQGGSLFPYLIARSSDGKPRYVPNALADRVVGLYAIGAILACLVHRNRTGRGQRIDIPMFESMVSFILADHLGGLTFDPPLDEGGYSRQLSTQRRPYETKDGYICVVIFTTPQWHRFFDIAGRNDLREDPRFASVSSRSENVDTLYTELESIMRSRTTDEWMRLLAEADIPSMRMNSFETLLEDEHLIARDFFSIVEHPSEGLLRTTRVPVDWSEANLCPSRLAPTLGKHSHEILAEAGFADSEIEAMVRAGVTTRG